MKVLERLPPCGCITSECGGLTCVSVVITTPQDHNMTNHQILEQVPGDCITVQEAPKTHLSNKSSGPGHDCLLNRQHPDHYELIANDGQYEDRIAQEARVERISPQQRAK